jgi:hypothetical protein
LVKHVLAIWAGKLTLLAVRRRESMFTSEWFKNNGVSPATALSYAYHLQTAQVMGFLIGRGTTFESDHINDAQRVFVAASTVPMFFVSLDIARRFASSMPGKAILFSLMFLVLTTAIHGSFMPLIHSGLRLAQS